MAFVQSFAQGINAIRVANPDVKLRLSSDQGFTEPLVLVVEYPRVTADPAGRDVWCYTEMQDWSRGWAIAFQVKPLNGEKLSVSFFDRNNVVYTTWVELRAQVWQTVRIVFEQLRPNPYFQPRMPTPGCHST